MAEKWIYWFEELGSQHNDVVGKKCANLGEMTHLGMRVPPGFAISVGGYERFMRESGASEEIRGYVRENMDLLNDVDKQIQASRQIRKFIESKKMPVEMREELLDNYSLLCRRVGQNDMSVAVRSSGSVSMPGQMETYLNVQGANDLMTRIIQVWGSAFTTRAIAFRLESGMEIEKAPIGVAVLKMINAKCAGVVLTVIPTTGDTARLVVEGNWGLGESVVSGDITPDQFIVDKASGEWECTITPKTKMVCYHTSGTRVSDVPTHLQREPCLSPDELAEIARVSKHVEAHFNVPQDMEWVIDLDLPFPENVFWVQARPAKYVQKKADDSEYLAELMSRIFKM
jgi:pyruvate, water dikinase